MVPSIISFPSADSEIMRRALRGLVSTVMPSLRVVALVYAGLSGIAVLVVVVTAAVTPKTPVLQQVAEPAREAVTTLVQPTTDMVTGIMAAPPPPAPVMLAAPAPTQPPFVDMATLDVVIDAAPTPEPLMAVPARPRAVYVAPTAPAAQADQALGQDDASSDDVADADAPADNVVVTVPQDAPSMQEAGAEPPKPLPTPTVVIPTTPEQVKAQVDAANQAAIDAARAAAGQAKAQADSANQAAIDAAKGATAPTLADSALALATPSPKQTTDAARLEAAKAKAEADAANQLAIEAARAAAARAKH